MKPSLTAGLRSAKTLIVVLRRELKSTGEIEGLTADQALQKVVELLGQEIQRTKGLGQ